MDLNLECMRMIQEDLKPRGIHNERVLHAMRTVPRNQFVPKTLQTLAYQDTALPIEEGQTISQPYIVALMAQEARLTPEDRVLEVGAGSGYAAAVLGHLAKQVYTIERHAALAALAKERLKNLGYTNIEVICCDGTAGDPENAPFDAILVTARAEAPPQPLIDQLAAHGRLIIPIGDRNGQELMRFTKDRMGKVHGESLESVRFVDLIGKFA